MNTVVRVHGLVLLLLLGGVGLAAAQTATPPSRGWNLDSIYPDDAAWARERDTIRARLRDIGAARHRAAETPAHLAAVMSAVADARGRAGRMAKVGVLQFDLDNSSTAARRRRDEGRLMEAEVEHAVAFLAPLLRDLGDARLTQWMRIEPGLTRHERRIRRVQRLAAHAADSSVEGLLEQLGRHGVTANDVYETLVASDLAWPRAPEGAGQDRLDRAAYVRLGRSLDARLRRESARAYLTHLAQYQEVFGLLLARRIESDRTIASLHGLTEATDRLLTLNDGLPPRGHRAMFGAIRGAAPRLTAAASAIRNLLAVDEVWLEDLVARPAAPTTAYPLALAQSITLQAVEPLGKEYQALLAGRFKLPWWHLAPARNVGVFWQVGGGNSHVVLPYTDDYRSARAFAGAATLLMGYESVPSSEPPDRREEDLPIFSNALWYLGRFMFDREVLRAEVPALERRRILAVQLFDLLATCVQGVVLAELESQISDRIAEGQAMSGADISALYLQLLRAYYEPAGIRVPEYHAAGWITFPTLFYGPHYASWAAARVAAVELDHGIQAGDRSMIGAVRDGIGRSRTHLSADILADAGIDLTSPAPYQRALQRIEALALQLQKLPGQ